MEAPHCARILMSVRWEFTIVMIIKPAEILTDFINVLQILISRYKNFRNFCLYQQNFLKNDWTIKEKVAYSSCPDK